MNKQENISSFVGYIHIYLYYLFPPRSNNSVPCSSYFRCDPSDFSNELNYLKYLAASHRLNPSVINKATIKLKNYKCPAGHSNEHCVNSAILFLIFPFFFFSKSLNFFHVLALKSALNLLIKLNFLLLKTLFPVRSIFLILHLFCDLGNIG